MSFAGDRLYNGYLRRNMPTIVSKVKVRDIVIHLPCLNAHDKETIEAKREQYGNYDGMVLLLDCLRRGENWPEEFIRALEACEQTALAAEIRTEYESLRGSTDPESSSPPATVVRAHVHPPPSAAPFLVPESGDRPEADVLPSAEVSAPGKPALARADKSPPPSEISEIPQSSAVQDPTEESSPEPAPEPAAEPASEPAPEPAAEPASEPLPTAGAETEPPTATPPTWPETPHHRATEPPSPASQRRDPEAEENSEADTGDDLGDSDLIPRDNSSPVSSDGAAWTFSAEEQVKIEAQIQPDPSTPPPVESTPPQSPLPAETASDEPRGLSPSTLIPEKPSVQDAVPPLEEQLASVLQPEETFEPPETGVVGGASVDPLPCADLEEDISECRGEPDRLPGIQPQNPDGTADPVSCMAAEPHAVERVESAAGQIPSGSPADDTMCTATAQPRQENGEAPNHDEPEDDRDGPVCESLQELQGDTHEAEEPSVQTSIPQIQINGDVAKDPAPLPATAGTPSDLMSPSGARRLPPEPLQDDTGMESVRDPKEKLATASKTKYILTAAGVGACALMMAWRLKKGI